MRSSEDVFGEVIRGTRCHKPYNPPTGVHLLDSSWFSFRFFLVLVGYVVLVGGMSLQAGKDGEASGRVLSEGTLLFL